MTADPGSAAALRSLPAVDAVLAHPALALALGELPRPVVLAAVREQLDERRRLLRNGAVDSDAAAGDVTAIAADAAALLALRSAPTLRPVVNATGVVIHTNLGRAPLGDAALAAMQDISRGYGTLEYDLETGKRGSRHGHVDWLLRALTGAEASLVVNNNAAALCLALAAHVGDDAPEVIVSRGQAVEIGGGFRIPDVLRQSGARLVEVGTTNRTRAGDYARAATPRTAAILRVHASNFRIVGFTETPSLQELRGVADDAGALLIDDIGSGCLLDVSRYGLAPEPAPRESIAAGADLVLFSGDKLLGGPQAGIIIGRETAVAPLRGHPLLRALRLDKTALAALAATLRSYLDGSAERDIPVWRMIAAEPDDLRRRAADWAAAAGIGSVEPGQSPIGGGSLPGETRPTFVWSIAAPDPAAFAAALRAHDPPVIARIRDDKVLLDPRTVLDGQDAHVISAVKHAAAPPS